MTWRIFLSILLALTGLLPVAPLAQAQAVAPSGFLVKTAARGEPLCPGDTIVYKLELFDTSPASVPAYSAEITDPLPPQVTFVAHDGPPGVTYDARTNTVSLTISVDPAGARGLRTPVSITVTVNSALADGTEIINLATGTLGGVTPVGAQVKSVVACDPTFEPPRDPNDYPAQPADPALDPDYETPQQLAPGRLPLDAQAAASLLTEPEIGDDDPPGYFDHQIFLPLIVRGGAPTVAAAAADGANAATSAASSPPRAGGPSCDYVYPWVSRHGMSESVYQADATQRDNAGYRPIAVSANGSGSDTRFAALWVKDNKYGENWSLKHGLTDATYTQWINTFKPSGLVPLAVDLYGTTADPRYVAIWGQESSPTVEIHGVNQAAMQTEIDKRASEGYRPVWVSGLGNPANNNPIFAGIWAKDALTGTMRIGLTAADISWNGIARTMTDRGFRMAHLSGYQVLDNGAVATRYAAVWVKGGPCDAARWEAYRDTTSTQYQIKASAQRAISSVKTVAAASITLNAADIGAFRIARVALMHNFATPPLPELSVINEATPGLFRNGDILVLQMAPGYELYVQERSNGNIKLRSWNPSDPTVAGQFFWLRSHQYRLVLQYNSSSGRWVELQRNNISPDYYYPVSIDEYGPTNGRLYNSVWRAGPADRAWRVTGIPVGSDPLAPFDSALQSYMQRRNVPGAALAVTVNGRLVLARGYSWENGALPAIQPDAAFRLASVSKPLTAIGIMRLAQNGQLNLDAKIKDIPGFDAWLKSNTWADPQIKNVTVRQLLHHTGGWDRDITADPMLNDFAVCTFQDPDALPTTQESIAAYARALPFDHTVGFAHAYSNFGYLLLGRIIETVSGKNYDTFMRDNVLTPVNAQGAFLGSNFAGGAKEVQYFTPINTTGASRLGWTGFNQPGRQLCNWQHAELTPSSYGGYNIDPMAAHGGWASSAIDLARVMVGVDDGTLVNATSRAAMWSRPDGRARRVAVYDSGAIQYLDRTLHARKGQPGMTFTGIKKIGDFIAIGNGLERFGSIEFKFSGFGAGHDLRLIYLTKGGAWRQLTADADGLADGTNGFTQDGSITFTPPLDWEPFVFSVADSQPKFYIWLYSTSTPTTPAVIDTAHPSGETGYALGWGTQEATATLAYSNGNGFLTPGNTIIGETSKATAVIQQVIPSASGPSAGTLVINTLRGGPFRANEKLLVGVNTAGKALSREWAQNAAAGHNGLLWGTRAFIQHRTDGVNWAVVFNQENAYDPYWYLPNDAAIVGALETLANDFTTNGKWPTINLFGLYD